MDVDIFVVVQKKGISGFRELTEHLFENLNVRTIRWRGGGFFDVEESYQKVVKDTEIFEYLRLAFGLNEKDSQEIVNGLITMGFLRVDRVFSDCRFISSNTGK